MPTQTEPMLSVAEVCELQPGDENNATWINPGFTGVVRKIEKRQTKSGKPFWPCQISDTTGSATVEVSFFTAPKFSEGDQIELSGSGLRRTEYNGKAQAAIGKATEVHVIGRSVHHEEQVQRAAESRPALDGSKPHISGQTVGMALKEALALVRECEPGARMNFNSPEFWKQVHQTASDIIRVSNSLEHGNLAKSVSERSGKLPTPSAPSATQPPQQSGRADPPPQKAKPAAGQDGQAFPTNGPDEDVPF